MSVARRSSFSYPRQWSPRVVPTWPVEFDPTHRLSQGLVAGYVPGSQTFLRDITGKFNASIVGAPTTGNGARGPGLIFNGTSSYLTLGNNASLHPASFTYIFWGSPSGATNPGGFTNGFIGGQPNSDAAFGIASSGKLVFVKSAIALIASSTTSPALNTMSQMCLTYNTPNYAFYINGALDSSGSSAQTFETSNTVTLCCSYAIGNIEYFYGFMDHAKIYSRALSADEIYGEYLGAFAMFRPIIRRQFYYAGVLARRRPLIVGAY